MRFQVLVRLIEIQRIFIRYGLDEFLKETSLYRPLRFIFFVSPWAWFERRLIISRAVRLRLALEELGPIFIKFGQALSTRRDLLPHDIADELAKLQDRVPPFEGAIAIDIIEKAYNRPLVESFRTFDINPLASASIAQVHIATLVDGTEVVVKVLRPKMRSVISRDLKVMHTLATIAQRKSGEARRLRVVEIIKEYEKTILDELDLMREAANASQLRRNFSGSDLLKVPLIHWDYCRINVMVMERIHGVTISNIAALNAAGTNIKLLAENGVKIFFTQVFKHNFFHADMHPGNIFVLLDDPEKPKYAAVDFGIIGILSLRDQHYLAENFLAILDQNYRRVAELHIESGWVPKNTRIDEMESAVRTVLEPISNRPIKDISFGTILLRLFDISRRFDMRIQPQLLLLQKTLLNIEGLGRDLYPELDIWHTAGPILKSWMRNRLGPRAQLRHFKQALPDILEVLRSLPPLLKVAVQDAQDGDLHLGIKAEGLTMLERRLQISERRNAGVTYATALLIAGVLWLSLSASWPILGYLFLLGAILVHWRSRCP